MRKRILLAVFVVALVLAGSATAAQAAVARAPQFKGYVALTFDDGPDARVTPYVLDVLARKGAKATFFVQGTHAQAAPKVLRRISAAGHQVGNHSVNHVYFPEVAADVQKTEIVDNQRFIASVTGRAPDLFRYPHGASTPEADAVLVANGLTAVSWQEQGIDDWTCPGARQIVQRVMQSVQSGTVILLHDGNEAAACGLRQYAYLADLIDRLRAAGYKIGKVRPSSVYSAANRSYVQVVAA